MTWPNVLSWQLVKNYRKPKFQLFPIIPIIWPGHMTSQSIPRYTLASHMTWPNVLSWQLQKLSQTKIPIISNYSNYLARSYD